MTENHVANLSKNISAQKTGISLLFSKYTSNVIQDYNFQTYDIKKDFVSKFPGYGVQVPLYDGRTLALKYLYISDDHITGASINGTSPNNTYVLREVVGY